MQTYKVGGAVRDRLLGLPVSDTDWVVVGSTPEDILKLGYQQVGRDFPVFLHPDTHEEYALARTERKSGTGYTGFDVHAAPDVTLEQDLYRRDLTINAMAEAEDGSLIDPYGGQQDLEARVLKHVSPAFSEDPLRVLRVARFAARFAYMGFTVADETLELMREITRSGELSALVAERVWQETARALNENRPDVYFQTLKSCGALEAILPEIDALYESGLSQQVMTALGRSVSLSHTLPVRFAVLVHLMDQDAIDSLCNRIRVPSICADLGRLVIKYHDLYTGSQELKADTVMSVLEGTDAFRRKERFPDFLASCEAIAGDGPQWRELSGVMTKALEQALEVETLSLLEKGLKGPEFGAVLRKARLAAVTRVVEQT